jgi:inhibitor of the pro-sigma K processing machinery
MSTSTILILSAIAIGIVIAVVRQVAKNPSVFFGGLIRNLVVGCIGLLVIDYVGKAIGVHVPLNFATAGVASVLGLPGIAALAVIEKWIL